MAQRMDLYMGNLALFQQACVSTLYSPWLHTFFCTGEDKKSAIFFQRCCKCQKSVRKRDCTDRRGSFGCADIQVCAGTLFFSICYEHIQVFYTRNSTADVKSALIKIHILPFKPAQLSHTDSCVHAKKNTEGKRIHIAEQAGIQFFIILTAHDLYITAA